MSSLSNISADLKQYLVVTTNYWAFTLTDGALRMLVILYFHQLAYSPIEIAMLFLFYEFFGVVTNLLGGWLGARLGLNVTMNIGLAIQIIALCMLLVPTSMLTVAWVMIAQALSGIAKDLNKMSAKSSIKALVPDDAQGRLFKWVAILTGSKNALKGLGFFLGGLLLTAFGFGQAILIMASGLFVIWLFSLVMLKSNTKQTSSKAKFSEIFSKSSSINTLSSARFFLFGARDVWFVVAVPVFLSQNLGWEHSSVGAFFACWVIAYGLIQSFAPKIIASKKGHIASGIVTAWAFSLALVALAITVAVFKEYQIAYSLVLGLMLFGAVFAINSSLHSYLIVSYSTADSVSMDVGFYYMANAMGRLIGTILSGLLFQQFGLPACLMASTLFLIAATLMSRKLP